MTVITISTVGFGEVAPLSQEAKLFTLFFILICLTVFAYAVKQLTVYFLNDHVFEQLKIIKTKKMTAKLKDHTLICGYGRNGIQAGARLLKHKHTFLVIEKDPTLISRSDKQIKFIAGDAREDKVLELANIKNAKYLISALPDDVDNLFVVLTARQLNPDLIIVSRVSYDFNQSKLIHAGANHVVMPDRIGGDHMGSLLVVPDLISFIDELSWVGDESPNLEEFSIDALPDKFLNRSISELEIRKNTNCNVVGFRDAKGKLTINPPANLKLEQNTKLIVLGNTNSINKLNTMFRLD